MATDLETVVAVPPAKMDDPVMDSGSGESVVLHGVAWKLYRRLRKMQQLPYSHDL